jgi:hypothetical protein
MVDSPALTSTEFLTKDASDDKHTENATPLRHHFHTQEGNVTRHEPRLTQAARANTQDNFLVVKYAFFIRLKTRWLRFVFKINYRVFT